VRCDQIFSPILDVELDILRLLASMG